MVDKCACDWIKPEWSATSTMHMLMWERSLSNDHYTLPWMHSCVRNSHFCYQVGDCARACTTSRWMELNWAQYQIGFGIEIRYNTNSIILMYIELYFRILGVPDARKKGRCISGNMPLDMGKERRWHQAIGHGDQGALHRWWRSIEGGGLGWRHVGAEARQGQMSIGSGSMPRVVECRATQRGGLVLNYWRRGVASIVNIVWYWGSNSNFEFLAIQSHIWSYPISFLNCKSQHLNPNGVAF